MATDGSSGKVIKIDESIAARRSELSPLIERAGASLPRNANTVAAVSSGWNDSWSEFGDGTDFGDFDDNTRND